MNLTWMKLDVNILNDSKIKIIRKYPNGNSLFVLWVGLLCLAMKSDITGYIYIAQGMPYTTADLSAEFDIEIKTVEMGLELFKRLGMIDNVEGNMIEICNFNKHQNIDNIEKLRIQNRNRVKKFREKQRNALLIHYQPITNDDVTQQNRIDKNRLDKNRLEEKKKEGFKKPSLLELQEYSKTRPTLIDCEAFLDFYESKGWQIGKNKMKDWRAAVRTWERRQKPVETEKERKAREYMENWRREDELARADK